MLALALTGYPAAAGALAVLAVPGAVLPVPPVPRVSGPAAG